MNPRNYQVLLYCPNRSGHHTNYARLVTAAFLRTGVNLHIATTSSVAQILEKDALGAGNPPLNILPISERSSAQPLARLKGQLNDLRQLTQLRRWNRIVIPAGDGLLQMLGLANVAGLRITPPGVPLEVLMLRGGIAYASTIRQHLKHSASWRLAECAPVSDRHHLDPVVIDWLKREKQGRVSWQLMPDPIEACPPVDKRAARTTFGLPSDGILVGCVGELNRRKGIHLLLQAFQGAELPPHVHLFLAGACAPEILTRAQRLSSSTAHKGRVHLCDRWLTDSELEMSLAAMDLVIVPYPGHIGSASIALRAMAVQRPILGSKSLWIARHVQDHGAGWVCDVEDSEVFQTALMESVDRLASWTPSPSGGELLRFNSPENFMRHWIRKTVEEIGGDNLARRAVLDPECLSQ